MSTGATVAELAAENAALRELLEVYEATSVEQARKLNSAMSALQERGQRLLELERERSRLAEEQARRLERELEIAAQIQTSILPRSYQVRGFDVAGSMLPAERVGGDYFDVLPTGDGCWLGIGDVSGHGLSAGLIMLMTQCAVAALVRRDPLISPAEALAAINDVLFENIRQRLRQDEHMTLTLLHLETTGRLRFAGAHEDLLVLRSASRSVEHVQTSGAWVGARLAIEDVTVESNLQLERGDVLVLYSDGVIEARNSAREEFGTERVAQVMKQAGQKTASEICVDIFRKVGEWANVAADDRTVVVIRRAA